MCATISSQIEGDPELEAALIATASNRNNTTPAPIRGMGEGFRRVAAGIQSSEYATMVSAAKSATVGHGWAVAAPLQASTTSIAATIPAA